MIPNGNENQQIRLALCGLPTMVDDIVSVFVGEAHDIVIVARLVPSAHLKADFERSGADVLICAVAEAEMERQWRDLVEQDPLPAVLNLGHDAMRGRLYALHPTTHPLDELSATSLLRAVRDHMRSSAANGDACD